MGVRVFKLLSIVLVLTQLVGCSMLEKSGSSSQFKLRNHKKETLSNGLQIVWIPDNALPRTSIQLLLKAGSIYESNDEAGLNSLVADMLGESTKKRNALELASELEFYGLDFGARGGADSTVMSISGLSMYQTQMIDFFSEILMESTFDEKDLERRKAITLAGIRRIQDNPSSVADISFNRALFPGHPYGRLVQGELRTVQGLSREDCLRFFKVYYRPQRAMLAVTGQFDEKFKGQVRKALGAWESWENIDTLPKLEIDFKSEMLTFHKKDLEQTQIRFGHLSIPRNHPDFLKLRAANMVFGGAFASRLNQKIRDDLGLTYSVSSINDTNLLAGSFEVSTFTRHDKVQEMVTQVRELYSALVKEGITERELEGAKSVMIGQFPMAVETTDRLAYNMLALWAWGVDESYLSTFQKQVRALTVQDVNEAIQKHLKPEALKTLIYTDRSKAQKDLQALGIKNIQEFKL